MENSILKEKKIMSASDLKSSFSDESDSFTSLSTTALIAKNSVPASHKRIANNYIIIKRIYKFQVVQSKISNQEISLLKKYDLNTLESSTIKQINEELIFLKKWAYSQNEELSQDAESILEIRSKELKLQ